MKVKDVVENAVDSLDWDAIVSEAMAADDFLCWEQVMWGMEKAVELQTAKAISRWRYSAKEALKDG
jgi:hypothetical protein